MSKFNLSRWIPAVKTNAPIRRTRLALQSLETREVPATHIWTDLGVSNNWSDAGNWSGGVPTTGEAGGTIVQIPINDSSMFQDIGGLVLNQLQFTNSGSSTLTLNTSLGISGNVLTNNVVNTSGTNTITGTSGNELHLAGSSNPFFAMTAGQLTVNAVISGPHDLVLNSGGGVLELKQDNAFTGDTKVNQGILRLNVTNGGSLTIAPGSHLYVGNGDTNVAEAFVQLGSSGQLSQATPVTVAQDGILSLLNGSSNGIGDLTLSGGKVSTSTGELSVTTIHATSDSTIDSSPGGFLGLSNGQHTITVDSGKTLTITAPIQNADLGGGGIIKDGAGVLAYQNNQLAHPNTYTGTTWVKDGGLTLQDAAFDSAFLGNLVIGDGVGVPGSAFVRLDASQEIPNTASVKIDFDGELDLNNHQETIGALTINGGGSIQNTGTYSLTLNGDVTVPFSVNTHATINSNVNIGASRSITVDNPNLGLIINGQITGGSANGGLFKYGVGDLELRGLASAPNTYLGQTRVSGGSLTLNHGSTLAISDALTIENGVVRLLRSDEIPDAADLTIFQTGSLDLNGFQDAVHNLALRPGSSISTGAGLLILNGSVHFDSGVSGSATINGQLQLTGGDHSFNVVGLNQDQDPVINAVISGSGGIVMTGFSPLTLNGNNTYTGNTTLQSGTLIVNGIQLGSNVVATGGVLAGTGTIGNYNGGASQIAPGVAGIGTLQTQNLILSGSTYIAEVNGLGQSDRIGVHGTVDLTGATLGLSVLSATARGQTFTIVDNDGSDAVTGAFNGLAEGAMFQSGGRTFRITYKGGDGNDVLVTDATKPIDLLAVSAGPGVGSHVRVFNADGSVRFDFAPFDGYDGGVTVATGDVNGDGMDDIIVGAGPGAPGGHVKVFDGATGSEIRSFFAFDGYLGGVNVGAGDLDGDGRDEVLVGAGAGTPGGHVKAFDGATGAEVRSFFAYVGFLGGVNVSAGDLNGDGRDEIITGTSTDNSHIKAFDAAGAEVRSFLAFDGFTGGVSVGAGDINGDGKADILVGAASAVSHAVVFDGASGSEVQSFLAFDGFPGGVHIAGTDRNGDGLTDIAVGAGAGGNGHLKVFSGLDDVELASLFSLDAIGGAPIYVG